MCGLDTNVSPFISSWVAICQGCVGLREINGWVNKGKFVSVTNELKT